MKNPIFAIILGILPGTDGVIKMSKSLGNHIPINTDAKDMYGKVMSIPDFAMPTFARMVTRWTPAQIADQEKALSDGLLHPRDAKMKLAYEISASFYSETEAEEAQGAFISLFQQREIPSELAEFFLTVPCTLVDLLTLTGLTKSKNEARRLVEQKWSAFGRGLVIRSASGD